MKTEELIVGLSRDLPPVRPLAPPGRRLAVWLAVTLPVIALGILAWGPRPDLRTAIADWHVQTQGLLALAAMCAAAAAALVLAVPGREGRSPWRGLVVGIAAVWALLLVAFVDEQGRGFAGALAWPFAVCVTKVISVAAVPAAVLFALVRRAMPLRPAWAAGLAVLGGAAAGAVAVLFACPVNAAPHLVAAHFAPVLALWAIGAAALARLVGPART